MVFAEQIRERQLPIKEAYRQDPSRAVVRFSSRGRLVPDTIGCRVETFAGTLYSALHPAAGGDETSYCSADMLLDALVACLGVTLSAVAAARGLKIHEGTIEAEALYDFRGTLGLDRNVPVGIPGIDVKVSLQCDGTSEDRQRLLEIAERYCLIYQTLQHPPKIRVRLEP